jgi:hypothetical protein
MKDIFRTTRTVIALAPAARNADNTSDAIDIRGFRSVLLQIAVGIGGITFSGTNKVEYKLQHSLNGTDFDAVAQRDVSGVTVTGAGIVRALIAAHATPSIVPVGYIGGRPFLRLFTDFSGTHGTPTPMGALVLLADPNLGPVA